MIIQSLFSILDYHNRSKTMTNIRRSTMKSTLAAALTSLLALTAVSMAQITPSIVKTATAAGGNTTSSPSTAALNTSVTGGNVLVVGAYIDANSTGAGATFTFNGNAPTGRISSGRGAMAYYRTNAQDTAVTISVSGNASSVGLVIWELANVDLTLGVVNAAGGDTITTTAANTFVLGTAFRNGNATLTRTGAVYDTTDIAPYAILGNAPVTGVIGGASGLAETAGSQNISWNNDTDGSVLAFGFVARPASGPGPVNSFTISGISSPQTVGTPINNITITARDASNATATGFTGTVNFGGTGGFTGTSASFTAGVLSGVSVTPTVAGSNLTFTVDDGASHTGSTSITTIQTQYQFWAGGAAFDADANSDGVSNGMAFLLGAVSPSTAVTLPTVSQSGGDLIMDFNCLPDAARGNATLLVEHSSDLGLLDAWTATSNEVPDATNAIPDNDVTFVVDTISVAPLNKITATIGSAAAAGNKLFGRLKAVEMP